jgi:hypothetical protein
LFLGTDRATNGRKQDQREAGMSEFIRITTSMPKTSRAVLE